jgi:hypothetical protein
MCRGSCCQQNSEPLYADKTVRQRLARQTLTADDTIRAGRLALGKHPRRISRSASDLDPIWLHTELLDGPSPGSYPARLLRNARQEV